MANREWWDEFGGVKAASKWGGDLSTSVEEMYQAFKARMIEESEGIYNHDEHATCEHHRTQITSYKAGPYRWIEICQGCGKQFAMTMGNTRVPYRG